MNADKSLLERVQEDFPEHKVRLDENDKIRFNTPSLNRADIAKLNWYSTYKPEVKRSGTGLVVIFTD